MKRFFLFIIILILSIILVFQDQNTFIRFLLVTWLIGSTMHFFREKEKVIKKDFDSSKMKLYHSGDSKTTEDIISDMKNDGYRPAELDETLVWLKNHPNKFQGFESLVALGSFQVIDKMGRVPIVDIYEDKNPYLGYNSQGEEWDKNYYFIGVSTMINNKNKHEERGTRKNKKD